MRRVIDAEANHAVLTPYEAKILRALLSDGADTATVALRTGYAASTCNRVLSDIAKLFDMTRMEMVVGFLRGQVTYTVSELHGVKKLQQRAMQCA